MAFTLQWTLPDSGRYVKYEFAMHRLRAQEMALLRIREIAALCDEFACGYKIKCGFYSPNTLQDHMATMLREWSGIDYASSHFGRRHWQRNYYMTKASI